MRLRVQLREGQLDHRFVEIEAREHAFPAFEVVTGSSVEEIGINLKEMLPGFFQGRSKTRRLSVPEALAQLVEDEQQKLIDMEHVSKTAVHRVEQSGIIFIDEINKIAGREGSQGPDVSREGVQRDLLPIVEGTSVTTKHGLVRTDHILFIAAGAFHVSKPSDLIPESPMDVLTNPDKAEVPRELDRVFAIMGSLVDYVKGTPKLLDNYLAYVTRLKPEFTTVGIRDAALVLPSTMLNKRTQKWMEANGHLFSVESAPHAGRQGQWATPGCRLLYFSRRAL